MGYFFEKLNRRRPDAKWCPAPLDEEGMRIMDFRKDPRDRCGDLHRVGKAFDVTKGGKG